MSELKSILSYCPSMFKYPLLSKKRLLPCLATVRIVRKVDCGTYWVIDKSVSLLLDKQILQPYYELLPDIDVGRSYACIASVVRPSQDCARQQFCRAVASNFNKCDGSCTVFLIDFGETVASNVYSLYRLTGQPPIVFEAPGAAFLCVIKQRSQSYQRYAKLSQDDTYVIEVLAVDENEKFSSLLYNASPLEILNEMPENEICEEQELRGSMLSHWIHCPTSEVLNEKQCIDLEYSENETTQKRQRNHLRSGKVKDIKRLKENYRLAMTVAKLETRIDIQYEELCRKLDGLLYSRPIQGTLQFSTSCEENRYPDRWQHRNLWCGEDFNSKQSRSGFRKHNNRGMRSRTFSSFPRSIQSYNTPKGTPSKFSKHFEATNDASTQTYFERLDCCLSRQSLATTTCSSANEVELDESSLCASDTYSLTSPSKLTEKDGEEETSSVSTFPGVLSALFPSSAGTLCQGSKVYQKAMTELPAIVERQKYRRPGPLRQFKVTAKARAAVYAGDLCKTINSGAERCWICGKIGSLTRYCVAEPSVFSDLLGNNGRKISESRIELTSVRKRTKKEVVYTEDESSTEESEEESISETSCCNFSVSKYCTSR